MRNSGLIPVTGWGLSLLWGLCGLWGPSRLRGLGHLWGSERRAVFTTDPGMVIPSVARERRCPWHDDVATGADRFGALCQEKCRRDGQGRPRQAGECPDDEAFPCGGTIQFGESAEPFDRDDDRYGCERS